MSTPKPIKAGERFGRLVAISVAHSRKGLTHWHCQCDCGATRVVVGTSLRAGRSKSCGCLKQEQLVARVRVHGKSHTRVYYSWQNMIQRCTDPHNISYPNYGARGIKVCERWRKFENFLADMGEKPPDHSLERIDNSGDYEPSNCVWATRKIQNRNTRRNLFVSFDGETKTLAEWAEQVGCKYMTLFARIKKYGWTVEKALTTPTGAPHGYR